MRYSDNYNLKLPQRGVDRANVDDLDSNFETIDGALADDRQISLPMYDSTQSYNTGDIRGYENPTTHRIRAFRCLEDNVTGPWDATKWAQTTLADEIGTGGGASSLADLTDTDITSPSNGQTLKYNSTSGKWENASGGAVSDLDDLGDVDITTPSDGDLLTYDAQNDEWVNAPASVPDLGDLGDVTLTTPTEGQILEFDGDEWVNTDAPDVDVTKTATGNPIEISDGASAPLVKCVSEIQGSQDLHGYDKPWVGGAGKNKLNPATTPVNAYIDSNNKIVSNSNNRTIYMECIPNTTYSYTWGRKAITGNDDSKVIAFETTPNIGDTGTFMLNLSSNSETYKGTFTTGANDHYLAIKIANIINSDYQETIDNSQIELGSTATTYEPYSNICPITAYTEGEIEVSDGDGNTTTHTTTYPSSIYRGSEDVVKGEVTSEFVFADFTNSDWSPSSPENHVFRCILTSIVSDSIDISALTSLCNKYATMSWSDISSSDNGKYSYAVPANRLIIVDHRFSTTADFIASLSDIQLVLKLATPTTSSVTPTNLPVKSLNGYSHIESSTGNMEIEYITSKYNPIIEIAERETKTIDEMLTENIESSMTASQNYTSGELLIACGKIYRATANIASGSSLTVGTNVTQTTIEAEIARSGGGVNYSTTEHVVGTWIDGSDVYEKTFYYASLNSSRNDWAELETFSLNLMIDHTAVGAYGGRQNGIEYIRISYYNGKLYYTTPEITVGSTITDVYVTIRYTKSS